jgi:uncharacterized membrane protein YjjB (DUF3815 family)
MDEYIYIMIGSLLGAMGYALLAKASVKSLVPIFIVTTLGAVVYCVCDSLDFSVFAAHMSSAFVVCALSEISARICRMPAVVIMFPSLIPLVPGRPLYLMVSNMINKNYGLAFDNGETTLLVASGIAGGMILSMVIFATVNTVFLYLIKKKRQKKS